MSADDPSVEVEVSDDGRTCTLTCPYCGQKHRHGLGEQGDLFGDRMAHCHLGGYVLARPQHEADTVHTFVVWLRRQDGKEWRQGTPLGDFAREFAPLFPATGDRATLRRVVENVVGADPDSWTLSCFDVAWRQYDPKCAVPDCNHPAGDDMSLCAVHVQMEDLL